MLKRICLSVVATLLLFAGCKKADQYPIEPVITFKSLVTVKDASGIYDDKAILEISFTDGDGDIGLNDYDTIPPYTGEYVNNVHIIYHYKLASGEWRDSSQFDDLFRVQVLTPEGSQKAIRGDISKDKIGFPFSQQNVAVRFDVYIYDRALHKSNVITTPEIIINTN